MWWQQPSSQIFLSSLLTQLSEAYPSKHGCPLPSICWVIGLQTFTLFSKEVWLLEQHHLFVVTGPHPRTNNLLALINTWLSLGSLASLSVARPNTLIQFSYLHTCIQACATNDSKCQLKSHKSNNVDQEYIKTPRPSLGSSASNLDHRHPLDQPRDYYCNRSNKICHQDWQQWHK